MHIRVLGSAAGGGYPQWNCNHPNSRRARRNDPAAQQRTQSSIALSADGERWFLCNASPDLRQQIADNDILHPSEGLRHSPIQASCYQRRRRPHGGPAEPARIAALTLYGTGKVLDVLAANSIFNVLNPRFVARETLALDEPTRWCAPTAANRG